MSHPSDKDLDRLVRAAAEQYDAEQNASGWEKLRQRLDIELPPEEDKDRRRFLWLLLLITALTGGGLAWMITGGRTQKGMLADNTTASAPKATPAPMAAYHQQPVTGGDATNATIQRSSGADKAKQGRNKKDSNNSSETGPISHTADGEHPAQNGEWKNGDHAAAINPLRGTNGGERAAQNGVGKNRDHAVATNSPHGTNGVEQSIRYNDGESDKSKVGSNPAHRVTGNERMAPHMAGTPVLNRSRRGSRKYYTGSPAGLINVNRTGGHRRRSGSISGKKASHIDTGKDTDITTMNNRNNGRAADFNQPGDQQNIKNEEEGIAGNNAPAAGRNNPRPSTDTSHITRGTITEQADSNVLASQKPVLPRSRERGWEIGLLAGPDISNVAFRNSNKTGYNFGLQLGYRLSRRWSVTTGIIYTKKNYDAQERDYHPSKPYSYSSTQLDMVEGYCQMLDIPVNVRYNLTTAPKATWFLSTGISSYFMKRQYYDYYLHNVYTGAPRMYGWDNRAESNHILSILNISAGWERSVNKHLSIQAEPYLKMPLTGIGYGKMMINSYGLLLSVKYKPSFQSRGKR